MYSFKNDYSEIGHKKVLEDLLKISDRQLGSYGEDVITDEAKELILRQFGCAADGIHFISGGTQTNLVFLNSALRPIEAVISPDSGHINVHEAGAVEHNGNRIITVPNKDGKLTPESIDEAVKNFTDEHTVRPKLVFISQSTELGTVYSKKELEAIYKTVKKSGLYLYIDGARLGAALTAENSNLAPKDITENCDAFYIGGTKNGSPLGEALCIVNDGLRANFRHYLKQHGALLSKGALIGSCFKTLFENGLYFELARRANGSAQKIAKALKEKGYKMNSDSVTNQIFPIVSNRKIAELQKHFEFYIWSGFDKDSSVIRLVTSFATVGGEIDRLLSML